MEGRPGREQVAGDPGRCRRASRAAVGTIATVAVAFALGCSGVSGERPQARPENTPAPAATTTTRKPEVVPAPSPAATPAPSAPKPEPVVDRPVGAPSDNTVRGWGYTRNKTHTVPDVGTKERKILEKYDAVYVGDTSGKTVYLTFDEGYENGNTPRILDTLKDRDVRATFFVTGTYCRDAQDVCSRIVEEGHVVGSHGWSHASMPAKAEDAAAFEREFSKTEAAFEKATGRSIARLFRPPSGEYSALSLWRTSKLGYRSVFWSFAHVDYDEKAQPPVDVTVERVLAGSHPGAIILLHAISASDTTALPAIIDGLRDQGYRFATLDELPR